MNDIRTLLKVAARRLELSTFLDRLHVVAVVVAAIALVLMIADRVGESAFVPWTWAAPALVVLAAATAAVLWSRRRRDELQVAMAVDERLDLREKLSTALHVSGRTDPFAQAAVEDAVATARDPRVREATKRRFGVEAPRGWWVSPLIVLAALMTSMLQPLNLFADDEADDGIDSVVEVRSQAEETVNAVLREIKEAPELSKSMDDLLGELTKAGLDTDELKQPEQVKREALKKVTEINKRLEEILTGEDAKTAEALRKNLSGLDPPEDGPAADLAEAMAKGDFSGAKEALQKLMEKMEKGELDGGAAEQAAKQLADLAQQLEQLAEQQKALQKALEQAGLDPALANNPEALKQALQNNPNLNQQQMQQIQQMAQAQQAAAQMCQNMGKACAQMAQAMKMGQMGQGQMGQGAGDLADQLSQAEQLTMMLQQAQAAAKMCQGQCQGLGLAALDGNRFGPGMGNRGMGAGGKAPLAPTPWKSQLEKANVNTREGDIIARTLFDGPEVVGESTIQIRQIAVEMAEASDDAMVEELLPRKYHDPHKHYFGEMQKLTEARAAEAAKSGDASGDAPKAPAGAGGGS